MARAKGGVGVAVDEPATDDAYLEYLEDQYQRLIDSGALSELEEEPLDRILHDVLAFSETNALRAKSELAKAALLLEGDNQDRSAAFFHSYRSLDGYLSNVIDKPIAVVLLKPIAGLFKKAQGPR